MRASASPMAMLLFLLAVGCGAVELPLLEASGAASGSLLVAGSFAPETYGALLQSNASVLLLDGPTPHVAAIHTDLLPVGVPIAGTASIGLVPQAPNVSALCVIMKVKGVETLAVSAVGRFPWHTLPISGAVSIATLGPNSLVILSASSPTPFQLIAADTTSGSLHLVSASTLGVAPKPGYTWNSIGAGHGLLAAIRSSSSSSPFQRRDILEVFLFSTSGSGATPALIASSTLHASSKTNVISIAVADVYADGAPHVLLTYSDSTTDVLWCTDGAEPLYRAASFRLDPSPWFSGYEWASVAHGAWLGSNPAVLPGESLIMGLRLIPSPAPPPPPPHSHHYQSRTLASPSAEASFLSSASALESPAAPPPTPPPPPPFNTPLLLFGRPEHCLHLKRPRHARVQEYLRRQRAQCRKHHRPARRRRLQESSHICPRQHVQLHGVRLLVPSLVVLTALRI